jgi:S-DNA-T family DNA segregation ATPase FtsK/SpoIIIE
VSKKKKIKNGNKADSKKAGPILTFNSFSTRYFGGIFAVIFSVIVFLSFFGKAGPAGETLKRILLLLIGKTTFSLPLLFLVSALIFFKPRYKNFFYTLLLSNLLFIISFSGILESLEQGNFAGGWLGYLITTPFLKLFDFLVTQIIFSVLGILSFLIIGNLIKPYFVREGRKKEEASEVLKESVFFGDKKTISPESFVGKVFNKMISREKDKTGVQNIYRSENQIKDNRKEKELASNPTQKKPLDESLNYLFPQTNLLEKDSEKATPGDIKEGIIIIKKTLQNFGIEVEMSDVNIGPTVTQYTLKPAEGVKLSKITSLSNDLALALAAHPIRIEAPIPGKSLVGIEVPNKSRARVRLRGLIENEKFQHGNNLTIALGKDVTGNPLYGDLARMPHLLVAGSTGSGKTIFLNVLILSLLYKNTPSLLRFILIDPKRVELVVYNNLPHLLAPVIFDSTQAVNALRWAILEMERRFDVLSAAKSRDITSYNSKVSDSQDLMPNIVIVIDELADLMAAKGREMEAGIVRLAQMARAVGIHLVVATQRPSVEVITGLIKANITSRIAFQVASQVDSRTILDSAGAEKLLGSGDLLYSSPEFGKPRRIQAAFVSEKEVKRVTDFIRNEAERNKLKINDNILEELNEKLQQGLELGVDLDFGDSKTDPLYEAAKREVILARKASASLLQRRLSIGYARAARLIDMLEREGVIGPGEGSKPREVYVKEESPVGSSDNSENNQTKLDFFEEDENKDDEWKKV